MAEVGNAEAKVAATVAVEGKKSKKVAASSGVKKPKSKPTHPPTAQMVNSAIKDLKERTGSSLPAIKKYLAANYKVDAEKLAPFIKKYLKNSVANGKLIQTKGKGASGSFKLPPGSAKKSEKGESVVKKKKTATKKPKEKLVKDKSEKKKSEKKKSEKKKSAVSAAKSVKKVGSPKAKVAKPKKEKPKKEKAVKSATKSPKTPKPKKLAAPKKTVTKKVVKK